MEYANLEIDGIDVGKGLKMTGGEQGTYFHVLQLLYDNGIAFVHELKKCAAEEIIMQYVTHGQAIKSVLASVGATELTAVAAELAAAADRKDVEYINENSESFLANLESLLGSIQKVITDKRIIGVNDNESKDSQAQLTNRRKILVVDDAHSFLLILNNILKDDYETMIAIDGEDGLKTARTTKPDLILLDVVMPGISGFDVLCRLKSDDELKNIPVILISGKDSEENMKKGFEKGAVDYIVKPFEKEKVLKKVGKVFM